MKAYSRTSLPVIKLNVSSPEGDDNQKPKCHKIEPNPSKDRAMHVQESLRQEQIDNIQTATENRIMLVKRQLQRKI